jgi:hypothetical protein
MGIQNVRDVDLIRHAYVLSGKQGRGVGGALIEHLQQIAERPMLVGTWADATWAIRFYERHGFELVTPAEKDRLLREYWSIPERQIDTSVVLSDPRHRERASRPRRNARNRNICHPPQTQRQARCVRATPWLTDDNPADRHRESNEFDD